MTQLRDIMTTQVAAVSPHDNVYEAASLMKQHNVGMIPVVENGQLRGVITDRDLVIRGIADRKPNSQQVTEVMTEAPVTARPDMTVDEAAQLMARYQIRRLPVVENGRLVGVVSIGDLAVRQPYADEAGQALSNISEPSRPVM
jgi:CBS domain-containing protein